MQIGVDTMEKSMGSSLKIKTSHVSTTSRLYITYIFKTTFRELRFEVRM